MRLAAVLRLVGAFACGVIAVPAFTTLATAQPAAGRSGVYVALETFGDILTVTVREYIRPVDQVKLINDATNAMLKSLDSQSGYQPASTQPVSTNAIKVSVQRNGDVAIVKFGRLSGLSASELDEGFRRELTNSGALKGVIIDLSDCDGGRIDDVVAVANRLLDSGPIFIERSRGGEATISAMSRNLVPGIRMAVLISPRTAEAGEILAGALRERRGATLVGARTAGRDGIVTAFPIRKGSGGIFSLLTAQAKLPSGTVFGGSGLAPDLTASPDQVVAKALAGLQ